LPEEMTAREHGGTVQLHTAWTATDVPPHPGPLPQGSQGRGDHVRVLSRFREVQCSEPGGSVMRLVHIPYQFRVEKSPGQENPHAGKKNPHAGKNSTGGKVHSKYAICLSICHAFGDRGSRQRWEIVSRGGKKLLRFSQIYSDLVIGKLDACRVRRPGKWEIIAALDRPPPITPLPSHDIMTNQ
jgi:hypothetical protein